MKTDNKIKAEKNLRKNSIASFFFSVLAFIIFGIWIYASENRSTQMESVEYFHSFFPELLQGRYSTIYLSIVILCSSLYFGAKAINISGKYWRLFNITVLALSGLLLSLNLFSLM